MNRVADLFDRQRALQLEADEVERELGLAALLAGIGRPVRVGSSALGLMVWRDLDITVICEGLEMPPVADAGALLAAHPQVRQVVIRDDTGAWNTDPSYPDGLYLGVECRSSAGHDWKVDIWFVDEPDRQPDLAHLRSMPPQLDEERRSAILLVKAAWHSRPEYGTTVRSFDVYSAVIEAGVRTLAEFDRWLVRGA